ncbi:Retrotransposon-derived protein PEG10 [Crotalus adamanteus]|uniref:Retrotransposon-derived protein PEG10 n=1 Tax=Crotalus adamanteus TaxID=8729 RepID=A0AAW1BCC5_CROAD
MFDRWAEKLTYFLNQVWIYLERHRVAYLDKGACVNTITAYLEGEVAEWMVALHDEEALELGNINAFLEGLWVRIGDPTQAHQMEAKIYSIRQGNQSMAEYIWEFCRLAGKLRGWPERLLVYQF